MSGLIGSSEEPEFREDPQPCCKDSGLLSSLQSYPVRVDPKRDMQESLSRQIQKSILNYRNFLAHGVADVMLTRCIFLLIW